MHFCSLGIGLKQLNPVASNSSPIKWGLEHLNDAHTRRCKKSQEANLKEKGKGAKVDVCVIVGDFESYASFPRSGKMMAWLVFILFFFNFIFPFITQRVSHI